MTDFDIKETEGRLLLKDILEQFKVKKIIFNPDQYGHWDAAYRDKDDNRVLVEIKTRDVKYESYETHLMQQDKFNWLKDAQKEKRMDKVLYINFFGDSSCYVYDLEEIDKYALRDQLYCNNSTVSYSEKINKQCLMIPKQIGLHFIKEGGIWKQV